jgi:hypothetical protein
MKRFWFSIFVLLLTGHIANATDFTQPINQLDGSPFTDGAGKPIVTTLETAAETALLANHQDEQNLSGDEKIKRYALALKIFNNKKDVNLTADEIALVKKLIAKVYSPLVVGEAWRMLDPTSIPK